MDTLHSHPLELAAGTGPSQFTLTHAHERGEAPHTHEVTPDGKTATSTEWHQTPQEEAIDAVVEMFSDGMFAQQVGPSFSCSEAELIGELLTAHGFTSAAQEWLYGHSTGDVEDDEHFNMPRPT